MKNLPEKPNIIFIPDFLSQVEATGFYNSLLSEINFVPDTMVRGTDVIETKRKYSFHGTDSYSYSGQEHKPKDFTPSLNEIKDKVEAAFPHKFNAVLCNFYDSSEVGMGYHADKEKELGDNPIIASINFGQTRRFSFRYRRDIGEIPTTHRVCEYELKHGSLLIMGEDCQKYFEHSLLRKDKNPANKEVLLETWPNRINLTFRNVLKPKPVLVPEVQANSHLKAKGAFTFKR